MVEKHVFKKADNQWVGCRLKEREAIARAFVAKNIYKHCFTSLLIKELQRLAVGEIIEELKGVL